MKKLRLSNTPSETELASPDEAEPKKQQNSKYGSFTDEELYKMIDEAVKTEDYEKAASIRDEIEKRKKKKG